MDTCHYAFVPIHRMYNIKSEPSCERWAVGDNDVSVRSSVVTHVAHGGGALKMAEAVCVWGRVMGNLCTFPSILR